MLYNVLSSNNALKNNFRKGDYVVVYFQAILNLFASIQNET